MPELSGGDQRFRDDRGVAAPAVLAALSAFADGSGSEQAALTALAESRLLVPVVAVLAEQPSVGDADGSDGEPGEVAAGSGGEPGEGAAGSGGEPGEGAAGLDGEPGEGAAGSDGEPGDGAAGSDGEPASPGSPRIGPHRGAEKASEMAMPTLVGRDGRRALPAFTSVQSLSRWQPAGRPVPVPASAVWQSAVQESCAVVIDVAGPVPIAVEGARLTALALGLPVPVLHEDPDVWQLAAAIAGEHAAGIRVKLSAPRTGLDLTVELAPPAGVAGQVPDQVASSVGEALSARLADRAPRGIAVVARAAAVSDRRPRR